MRKYAKFEPKVLGSNFFEKNLKKGLHFRKNCVNINKLLREQYAAVAQLDRVFGYEPKGQGFESLQPCQKTPKSEMTWEFSFCHLTQYIVYTSG